jgi:hypothetical protein
MSGNQVPFEFQFYQDALRTPARSYTAGINLFWVDPMWTATPGVPLRASAIEHMSNTTFKIPCALDGIHIAVSCPDFDPREHKGALLRVSPEEMTGAVVLAIARDIRNQESEEVLLDWRRSVLSATATFKVLPSASERYWYALQQRERISMIYKAVHRTTFQRVHEISRLMKRLRETTPASEITPALIAKAYADNLQMSPGSAATVTLNFVDCSATITNKILDNTDAAWCLQDLDDRSTLSGEPNPFDSHSRLQAIIDKCGGNRTGQLTWVVQGIWFHWRCGNLKYLSVADIKGGPQSGNRGLADLLLFKQQLKPVFLAKAAAMFPESADWFSIRVASTAESFKAWHDAAEAADKSWRAGRPPAEVKCLSFFSDVIFGKAYDAPLKLAVKSGKSPSDALQSPGLVEYLQEVEARRTLDRGADVLADDIAHEEAINPAGDDDLIFHLPAKDQTKDPTVVRASAVCGTKRDMLDSIINNTRQNIAAQIHLIAVEPDEPHPHGLPAAVNATPLGKLRGAPCPRDTNKSKYVGIFYDPKVAGEANHRPLLRVPPLRVEPYRRLIDLALGRCPEMTDAGEIPDGDLYMLFDAGKSGNLGELLRPFAGKLKSVKSFVLWRDEDSYQARHRRVRGIGSCQLQEGLHIVSADVPALRPVKFNTYKGTTAGTMIGPIIMPEPASLWQASWPVKKEIYTAANLIPVGGKAEDDDAAAPEPAAARAKPRDKDTIEPVFFHGLPESFYMELLAAVPLAGVLDLTPGDGSLALSAYKKGLVYVGLTFGTAHKTYLEQHLEKRIWKAMSDDADPLYEPRLVASLMEDSQPQPAQPAQPGQPPNPLPALPPNPLPAQPRNPQAANPPNPPPARRPPPPAAKAGRPAPGRKRPHPDPEDPVSDEGEGSGDNISGDDA